MASYRIGRAEDNDIVLPDKSVSRRHAELHELGGGRFRVKDLGSSAGTQVLTGADWADAANTEIGAETRIRFGEYETTPAVLLRGAGAARPAAPASARVQQSDAASPASAPSQGLDRRKIWWIAGGAAAVFFVLVVAAVVVVLSGAGGNEGAAEKGAPAPRAATAPPRAASPAPETPRRGAAVGEYEKRYADSCARRKSQRFCECMIKQGSDRYSGREREQAFEFFWHMIFATTGLEDTLYASLSRTNRRLMYEIADELIDFPAACENPAGLKAMRETGEQRIRRACGVRFSEPVCTCIMQTSLKDLAGVLRPRDYEGFGEFFELMLAEKVKEAKAVFGEYAIKTGHKIRAETYLKRSLKASALMRETIDRCTKT